MSLGDYLLLPLILLAFLLYPLLRKAVSLLEILVNKYVRNCAPRTDHTDSPAQTLFHLKLLAYERIILFVERMKPDSLIPRTLLPNLSAREYQRLLIQEIRKEYEYNLSQQLYLSENSWSIVTDFKNSIITLVNTASAEGESEQSSNELAKKILEKYIISDIQADQVLRIIKSDLKN